MTLRPAFGSTLMLMLLALGSGACKHGYSSDRTTPTGASALLAPQPVDFAAGPHSGRLLIPLAVGNRWLYRMRSQYVITTPDGTQPPQTSENPWEVEITGTVHIGERDYFLQSEQQPGAVQVGVPFRVRQDRSGLFELDPPDAVARPADASPDAFANELSAYVDRAVTDPAQRAAFQRAAAVVAAKIAAVQVAASGPDPDEITLLRYPLAVGARWIVRDSPRFARVVVARERVQVPLRTFTAWNVRGTSELFGPDDRVHFWYAAAGLVRIRYHFVGAATDAFGNVIGTVVSDHDQALTDLRLVTPGGAVAVAPEDE